MDLSGSSGPALERLLDRLPFNFYLHCAPLWHVESGWHPTCYLYCDWQCNSSNVPGSLVQVERQHSQLLLEVQSDKTCHNLFLSDNIDNALIVFNSLLQSKPDDWNVNTNLHQLHSFQQYEMVEEVWQSQWAPWKYLKLDDRHCKRLHYQRCMDEENWVSTLESRYQPDVSIDRWKFCTTIWNSDTVPDVVCLRIPP